MKHDFGSECCQEKYSFPFPSGKGRFFFTARPLHAYIILPTGLESALFSNPLTGHTGSRYCDILPLAIYTDPANFGAQRPARICIWAVVLTAVHISDTWFQAELFVSWENIQTVSILRPLICPDVAEIVRQFHVSPDHLPGSFSSINARVRVLDILSFFTHLRGAVKNPLFRKVVCYGAFYGFPI